MLSFRNIAIISKYEMKVLWRNWFFRIFSIMVITFLIFFNVGAYFVPDANWFHKAISWGIPYGNMIILNTVQAAVLVFLATGIIKHNKKLDTNEVFFVRPISNGDYVLGKAFAIFRLFFWLNIAILFIALVFNSISTDNVLNPLGYIIYPLITSLPTVFFITGLSFLVITILKNQAVSIVLLLGFIGMALIYFQGKYYFLLDYMAFKLPIMQSDIVGFSNLEKILNHRAIYVILGMAFLSGTIFFINRLPQSKAGKLLPALISVVIMALALKTIFSYLSREWEKQDLRQHMITLNNQLIGKENINILANDITLDHRNQTIVCSSDLIIQNNTTHALNAYFLMLNPGLRVAQISGHEAELSFERNLHIITIKPDVALEAGETDTIRIEYSGTIQEAVSYLDTDSIRRNKPYTQFLYNIEKRSAFLQSDYVLLTDEVLWYPTSVFGYSSANPSLNIKPFVNFSLTVNTSDGLTPISQGKMLKIEPGKYFFQPENPLPQISLTIGKYVKKSITVDSIEYSLYSHLNNDYYSEYFNEVGDTLATVIRELMQSYQQVQGLNYPFSRLSLVEAPIHFYAYSRLWENHQAYVQPEILLLPEKGSTIREADFKRQLRNLSWQSRNNNEVLNKKEKQIRIFENFIKVVLTKQSSGRRFFSGNDDSEIANYSLHPNLYWYAGGIHSKKWPLLNKSLATFLSQDKTNTSNDFSRNLNGISLEETCNQLVQEKELNEILAADLEWNKKAQIIKAKGEYLFAYLQHFIGQEEFKVFIADVLSKNRFQLIDYQHFKQEILTRYAVDIDPLIEQTYTQVSLPAFTVTDLIGYQVRDGNRTRYQVKFKLHNLEEISGIVKLKFNYSKERSRFDLNSSESEDDTDAQIIFLQGKQSKQLGLILDSQPSKLEINTLISKNIPSKIEMSFQKFELNEKAIPFNGENKINESQSKKQFEILVDNEDPGFSTFSPIRETYLKKLINERNKDKEPKYYGKWRRSSEKWRATTGSEYYGDYIRSAHFTRSGSGEKTATWSVQIKENGYYDIYVYVGSMYQESRSQNESNPRRTYHYIVHHDDGVDEVAMDVTNAEPGWNLLGAFYLSPGTAQIELTDKSDTRTIYADAVKWVKQ